MTDFVTVARVGEIPDGEGITREIGEQLVAVFNDGGQYFAINDMCPHQGALSSARRCRRRRRRLPLACLAIPHLRRNLVRQPPDQNRQLRSPRPRPGNPGPHPPRRSLTHPFSKRTPSHARATHQRPVSRSPTRPHRYGDAPVAGSRPNRGCPADRGPNRRMPSRTVTTAADTAGALQFAIVSDRAANPREGVFEAALAKLQLLRPDLVLSVGDFIHGYGDG